MARDVLFQENNATRDFTFDTKVAQVFDDMVGRSVPYYGEIQRMLAELALQFTPEQDGARVRSRLLHGHDARSDPVESQLPDERACLRCGQRPRHARAGEGEARALTWPPSG